MIRINGYPIDCALVERLRFEAEVTQNPVEKGADLTDHIQPKRPVLEFDGLVSDTPTGAIATDPSRTALAGGKVSPSRDAYDRFAAIHAAALPVVVECSYGKFDSMALESLTPTKDSKSAKAFKFSATFRQIEIQENQRTTIAIPNGSGEAKLGSREALLKYVGKNVVWVTSIKSTDTDGLVVGPDGRFAGGSIHRPKKHPLYGLPVLSTTSIQRQDANGYDRFGSVWVDHYRLAAGDKEDDNTMLQADGYVVLHDSGPNPQPGIKPNVHRGYYFVNTTFPGAHLGLSSHPNILGQNKGDGTVRDGQKRSLTQRPPAPGSWDKFVKNNQ